MGINTGKVREICQSEKVGTMMFSLNKVIILNKLFKNTPGWILGLSLFCEFSDHNCFVESSLLSGWRLQSN